MQRVMQEISLDQLELSEWIRPGDRVLWGQACSEPQSLVRLLMAQRHRVARADRVNVFLGIGAPGGALNLQAVDCIDFASYCGTGANRNLAKSGHLDILPSHYSQMAAMMADGRFRVDVLLLQVVPGTTPGRFRFALAQEYLSATLESARVVIAQCNPLAPAAFGQKELSEKDIDVLVRVAEPVIEMPSPAANPVEDRIAAHIASLVEDGDTLQFGLGNVPDATLARLHDRRDLGIHSGLLNDRAARLIELGVANGLRKTRDRGIAVTGVLMGSAPLFRLAHENPKILLSDTRYTHDAEVLASLHQFTAINSAIEVDLSGQVNTELARGVYVGAVGGSLDFLRGAARSRGGKPIIALPSTTGPQSRITARLDGPVSIPRSDIAFVVTEYGIADLRGATLKQRRQRLLDIAHPDHRAALDAAHSLL